MERSIVNRTFTVDRQVGVELARPTLRSARQRNIRYYIGAFTGEGRGVVQRRQPPDVRRASCSGTSWVETSPSGRRTSSAPKNRPAAWPSGLCHAHQGRPTRWSSNGGGNLDGYASIAKRDRTANTASTRRSPSTPSSTSGLSTQNEFHWKSITDRSLPTGFGGSRDRTSTASTRRSATSSTRSSHEFPEPLELAARYAWVKRAERDEPHQRQRTPGVHHCRQLVLRWPQQQDHARLLVSDSRRRHPRQRQVRKPRPPSVGHLVLSATRRRAASSLQVPSCDRSSGCDQSAGKLVAAPSGEILPEPRSAFRREHLRNGVSDPCHVGQYFIVPVGGREPSPAVV